MPKTHTHRSTNLTLSNPLGHDEKNRLAFTIRLPMLCDRFQQGDTRAILANNNYGSIDEARAAAAGGFR